MFAFQIRKTGGFFLGGEGGGGLYFFLLVRSTKGTVEEAISLPIIQ